MNFAIIVAAGSGIRFGSEIPKQFLELNGKAIIFHTLQRFEDCAAIDQTILVLAESEIPRFESNASQYNLSKLKTTVAGGKTRSESVWSGLQALDSALPTDIVAVHDGARPLVTIAEITETIEKAGETGAAVLVAPVTDTIKEIVDAKIIKTIERDNLRRALTPQCFCYELLQRAFVEAENLDAGSATDESFLVEKIGAAISIVEGGAQNIKITVPEDLILAEALMRQSKV